MRSGTRTRFHDGLHLCATGKLPNEKITEIVSRVFSFKPAAIVEYLDLLRPIYQKTAANGHFGREEPEFTWEKTNKVDEIRELAGLKRLAS